MAYRGFEPVVISLRSQLRIQLGFDLHLGSIRQDSFGVLRNTLSQFELTLIVCALLWHSNFVLHKH